MQVWKGPYIGTWVKLEHDPKSVDSRNILETAWANVATGKVVHFSYLLPDSEISS